MPSQRAHPQLLDLQTLDVEGTTVRDSALHDAVLFDKKFSRLEVKVLKADKFQDHLEDVMTPRRVYDMIVKLYLSTCKGFVAMEGMAPPGNLERQIQEQIDRLRVKWNLGKGGAKGGGKGWQPG